MNARKLEKQLSLLAEMGLTRLQGRVYLSLLRGSGRTGYSLAKELDVPVANTYKALESLRQSGLVLMEEGAKTKSYSAQPIDVFLDHQESEFARRRSLLKESLAEIRPSDGEEGFFYLENTEQLFTQLSDLIARGEDPIAVEGSGGPLARLTQELSTAANAGREIRVKAYSETAIPGCEVQCVGEMGSPVMELPIEFIHLVVPGEGFALGILDQESRLLHGVLVRNPILSILAYSGLMMELFVSRVLDTLRGGGSGEDVLAEWDELGRLAPSRTRAWHRFADSIGLGDELG